ncbi:hypothetical protein pipiens_008334 [Culex pipiens pipiens]|uniref:Reverse transcriptase domain-containing protein n=1 Tax=Culex pipiens pipiens TaxID=38569 RepID=A0ABD1DHW0_CULPP
MSYTACCRRRGKITSFLRICKKRSGSPIPKKRAPKEVNDFRRITLCNVIYKILTMYMLKKVDEIAQELPSYQAAFLANRCAEDHIFTARRVMEEYWNQGREFSYLYTAGVMRHDLLVITESLQELDELVGELKVLLEEAGLVIHPGKSELLVRDPYSTRVAVEDTFDIGGMSVKSKPYFRYLGAYLSATLNRPISVKQRCLQGIRVAKMLLPFIQKNKPPWVIARRIYTTVVVPSVIFGLNASALTAQNRRSLRRFERKIIKEWREACGEPPGITRKLLGLRTIVQRVKSGHFMYWGHICRRNENHLLQAALNLRLTGPKRRCRPCDTWWDSLDKELASLGKTRRDFEHLLGNKQDLKKEVDRACLVPEQSDSEVSSASESNQSASEESGHLNQSVRTDSSEVEQSDNEEGILERGETGESDQSETDDSGEVNHSDESDSEGF